MLTLYFCPGACSTASHIGLEEAGAQYVEKPVMLPKGEQKTEAYLKVNPRGKVPALDVDGKILTENTAILTWVAQKYADKKLMPSDPFEMARAISTMAWFSNIVHPSYTHYMRPERFAPDAAAQPSVKEAGKSAFWTNLQEIDSLLAMVAPTLFEYAAAFKADTWTKKQSGLCKGWCPVKSCEFWEEKRKKF